MRKYDYRSFLIFFAALLLIACGVKRNSSGTSGGGDLVQIFTKGKDSLLCFAGPIEYDAVNNKDEFEIDHTYLKVKNHSNPVVCNFSVRSKDSQFRPTSIVLNLDGQNFTTTELTKLFAEGQGKKDYVYRYSFEVSDSLFYRWMSSKSAAINVNDRSFNGGKKFKKASDIIYRSFLFDLY